MSGRYTPIGRSGEDEDLNDGTMVPRVLHRVHSAASGAELQKIVVALFGQHCFSAGVIAGMGSDIVSSAVDLLKLVGTFVLADLQDLRTNRVNWWRYVDPSMAPRLISAKVSGMFFEEELRKAAQERDEILEELSELFQNPKASFEGLADALADSYKKDWQKFNDHMKAGTLEGRFRAGMILGPLLLDVLGLLTGVAGVAKGAAKVAAKVPRLAKYAQSVGSKLRNRRPKPASPPPSTTPAEPPRKPRPPDPEAERKRTIARERRALDKRSGKGDKDATYELNKRENTKGSRAENAVIDGRGDSVIKAGEKNVKTSKTNTQIDVETKTEVIEVKSGDLQHYHGDSQLAKQAEYARSQNKQHVLAYDQNRYPDPSHPALQAIRDQHPDIRTEPWDFK